MQANDQIQLPQTFVRMFKPKFAALVESGAKTQTVRPTPKRMPRAGDTISLREWEGKPYRSKQRVLREAVITRVAALYLHYSEIDGMCWWEIEIGNRRLDSLEAIDFAAADGFSGGVQEMARWFQETHGLPFKGIVIYWSNEKLSHGGDNEQ